MLHGCLTLEHSKLAVGNIIGLIVSRNKDLELKLAQKDIELNLKILENTILKAKIRELESIDHNSLRKILDLKN